MKLMETAVTLQILVYMSIALLENKSLFKYLFIFAIKRECGSLYGFF